MKVLVSAAAVMTLLAIAGPSNAMEPILVYFNLSGGGHLEFTSFDGSSPDWTVCHDSSIASLDTRCRFLNDSNPSNQDWDWSPAESDPDDSGATPDLPDYILWMTEDDNYTFTDEDLICEITWPGVPVFSISLEVSPAC
jgi:hypothetical protein